MNETQAITHLMSRGISATRALSICDALANGGSPDGADLRYDAARNFYWVAS